MNTDTSVEISLALIDDTDRLREVDQPWAVALAGDIRERGRRIRGRGLQSPVQVMPAGPDGKHKLVFGAHRVAACRLLEWETIPARIFEGTALEARMAEIDENLVRRELGPLERMIFLAERKRVYLQMHPDAVRGKAGANKRFHAKLTISFASAVAKKIGLSPATIDADIAIAEALAPDVRRTLQDERLALRWSELKKLAVLTPEQQASAVGLLLEAQGVAGPCNVGTAVKLVQGIVDPKMSAEEETYRGLMMAWTKWTDAKGRARFLAAIAPKKGGAKP